MYLPSGFSLPFHASLLLTASVFLQIPGRVFKLESYHNLMILLIAFGCAGGLPPVYWKLHFLEAADMENQAIWVYSPRSAVVRLWGTHLVSFEKEQRGAR